MQLHAALVAALAVAAVPLADATCEVCGCDACPAGDFKVSNPE